MLHERSALNDHDLKDRAKELHDLLKALLTAAGASMEGGAALRRVAVGVLEQAAETLTIQDPCFQAGHVSSILTTRSMTIRVETSPPTTILCRWASILCAHGGHLRPFLRPFLLNAKCGI